MDQLGHRHNAGAFQLLVWLQQFGCELRQVFGIHPAPPLGHGSLSLRFFCLSFVGAHWMCLTETVFCHHDEWKMMIIIYENFKQNILLINECRTNVIWK